jgi:FMN phosphatase YigB (HAD superfamily)
MHIFFDFDRTLFNTEGFYTYLEDSYTKKLSSTNEIKDLSGLLYLDALSFLEIHKVQHLYYLLTFGERAIQEKKFVATGISRYFTGEVYVESGSKIGAFLQSPFRQLPPEEIVFIDDTIEHLELFRAALPKSLVVRMCRPGARGSEVVDDRFPTVTSLEELEQVIRGQGSEVITKD